MRASHAERRRRAKIEAEFTKRLASERRGRALAMAYPHLTLKEIARLDQTTRKGKSS